MTFGGASSLGEYEALPVGIRPKVSGMRVYEERLNAMQQKQEELSALVSSQHVVRKQCGQTGAGSQDTIQNILVTIPAHNQLCKIMSRSDSLGMTRLWRGGKKVGSETANLILKEKQTERNTKLSKILTLILRY